MLGGQAAITDAYLAALMLLAGLVAAAYAVSVITRLRAEETGAVAEPVLATATGRVRWALSHVAVAAGGAALLLAVAGVAAGLGYGLRAGSAGTWAAGMTGAALGQLPSALVLAAVAIALFGMLPRASAGGAWTALSLAVVISLFGQALQLSHWILDVSPFTHPRGCRAARCRPPRCRGWAPSPWRCPRPAWPACAAATSAELRQQPARAGTPEFGDRTLHTVADKLRMYPSGGGRAR